MYDYGAYLQPMDCGTSCKYSPHPGTDIFVCDLSGWNGRNGVLNRPHLHFNWSTPLTSSHPDRVSFGTLLPLSTGTPTGLGLGLVE